MVTTGKCERHYLTKFEPQNMLLWRGGMLYMILMMDMIAHEVWLHQEVTASLWR